MSTTDASTNSEEFLHSEENVNVEIVDFVHVILSCLEDGSDSPLISPCRCTGSVKYVHQTCLQKWIKGNDIKSCELCKYEFKMHTKLKPFSKVSLTLVTPCTVHMVASKISQLNHSPKLVSSLSQSFDTATQRISGCVEFVQRFYWRFELAATVNCLNSKVPLSIHEVSK